jgi:hypothetical protein
VHGPRPSRVAPSATAPLYEPGPVSADPLPPAAIAQLNSGRWSTKARKDTTLPSVTRYQPTVGMRASGRGSRGRTRYRHFLLHRRPLAAPLVDDLDHAFDALDGGIGAGHAPLVGLVADLTLALVSIALAGVATLPPVFPSQFVTAAGAPCRRPTCSDSSRTMPSPAKSWISRPDRSSTTPGRRRSRPCAGPGTPEAGARVSGCRRCDHRPRCRLAEGSILRVA